MMPLPLAALGVSVGSRLLGGLFGGQSKKKAEEARRQAEIERLKLQQNMAEDKRLGNLGAGSSLLSSLAGRGFTNISPEALAALQQRRQYDFSKAVPEAGAGAGSGLLAGLFGNVGDIASSYAMDKMDSGGGAGGGPGISPGQPIQTQATVDVADKLGSGGYKPFAPLQLDDFKPFNDDSPDFG